MGIAGQGDGGEDGKGTRIAVAQSLAAEGASDASLSTVAPIRPVHIFDRSSFAACALYIAVSLIFLGRALLFDFPGSYLGRYGDPSLFFIWSIAWWPYAISHRLNPMLPRVVFAPDPEPISPWSPTIPLAKPFRIADCGGHGGPIIAYNLLGFAGSGTRVVGDVRIVAVN